MVNVLGGEEVEKKGIGTCKDYYAMREGMEGGHSS
jgi:hypothetical protein